MVTITKAMDKIKRDRRQQDVNNNPNFQTINNTIRITMLVETGFQVTWLVLPSWTNLRGNKVTTAPRHISMTVSVCMTAMSHWTTQLLL